MNERENHIELLTTSFPDFPRFMIETIYDKHQKFSLTEEELKKKLETRNMIQRQSKENSGLLKLSSIEYDEKGIEKKKKKKKNFFILFFYL